MGHPPRLVVSTLIISKLIVSTRTITTRIVGTLIMLQRSTWPAAQAQRSEPARVQVSAH